MKRSGGRRYYRPDDVDLLKGIRRLLYGEGYTIRGVQRILKEHGIKSVQSLADSSAAVSFGAIEEAIGQTLLEDDASEPSAAPTDEEDDEEKEGFVETEEDILATFRGSPTRGRSGDGGELDRERLEGVLRDLIECRHVLEQVLKDG
jgi:DNA-binding transcriptional MerR regulator